MSWMFYNCENLNNVDLTSFDAQNVTNMNNMFCGCKNLNNLDLSSFDNKNITNMNSMFFECPVSLYQSNKCKFKNFKKEELI